MPSEIDFRFSLRLLSAGPDRLLTMAALRQLRPDLGLREAKALMDAIPCVVLSNISLDEKDNARRAFFRIAESELVNEWHDRGPAPPNRI